MVHLDQSLGVAKVLSSMTSSVRAGDHAAAMLAAEGSPIPLALSPSDIRTGQVLYEGPQSKVFAAELLHEGDNRPVAAKRPVLRSSAALEAFREEVAVLADLRDTPGIVRLVGARMLPPGYFMATDLEAGDVATRLHQDGWKPSVAMAARLLVPVAEALDVLHSRGYVHRDIKTSNLLLARDGGSFKLADFGLCVPALPIREQLQLARPPRAPSGGFRKALMVGTLEYMAPEVLRGEPHTPAADVFALGIVLNELLTRTAPYADAERDDPLLQTCLEMGYNRQDLMSAVAGGGLRPSKSKSLMQELSNLVDACWEDDPCSRPTAGMVAARLRHIASSLTDDDDDDEVFAEVGRPTTTPTDQGEEPSCSHDGSWSTVPPLPGQMCHFPSSCCSLASLAGSEDMAPPTPGIGPDVVALPSGLLSRAQSGVFVQPGEEEGGNDDLGRRLGSDDVTLPPEWLARYRDSAIGSKLRPSSPKTISSSPSSFSSPRKSTLVGICASPGPRGADKMEDRHIVASLPIGTGSHRDADNGPLLVGVFDGHRGPAAADYLANVVPSLATALLPSSRGPAELLASTLCLADEGFCRQSTPNQGATALFSLVLPGKSISLAWMGDCRAVLSRNGQAIALTNDHVCASEKERARVIQAGGRPWLLDGQWRLGTVGLAVTRAVGDADMRSQGLVAEPEVRDVPIIPTQDEFLVLASDGLWDVMSNEEAVRLVHDTVKEPDMCAKRLVSAAFERGSQDNVTALVVFLDPSLAGAHQQVAI